MRPCSCWYQNPSITFFTIRVGKWPPDKANDYFFWGESRERKRKQQNVSLDMSHRNSNEKKNNLSHTKRQPHEDIDKYQTKKVHSQIPSSSDGRKHLLTEYLEKAPENIRKWNKQESWYKEKPPKDITCFVLHTSYKWFCGQKRARRRREVAWISNY